MMQSVATMLGVMLRYQESLNDVFDPKWREHWRPYFRAALVESAEAIDHHGYKWWKNLKMNRDQLVLELVDVMHFYLSEIARFKNDPEQSRLYLLELWRKETSSIVFDGKTYNLDDLSLIEILDLMTGLHASKRIEFSVFRAAMKGIDLPFEQLYRIYAGKNVLNLFRQRNGDKNGTYKKVWSGREDNEYLSDLMKEWTEDEGMDVLYDRINESYKEYALA